MPNLLERVNDQLAEHRLLKRGARLVVAVSGGMDSMVLLHLLNALAPELGWMMSIAHFNHQLRGRSSDADERLVREIARRLKVPCDVGSRDVRRIARRQGVSIEMAAREARHAFLARCAQKRKTRIVALAHHADDQVELFLLRLLRGAGGQGLGGMKPISRSPADQTLSLVRPLLNITKEEIARFAADNRIRFRDDRSNASVEFDRNWIRHELLPRLRQRQPAVGKTILRAMQIAGADSDYVTQAADAWLKSRPSGGGTANSPFSTLHAAVQRCVLQQQVRGMGFEVDFQLVEQLRRSPDKAVSIAPGVELLRDSAGTVQRVRAAVMEFSPGQRVLELPGTDRGQPASERLNFAGVQLHWRILRSANGAVPERREGREVFDAEKVGTRMLLRHWRAGDRFQPIGMRSPVKLQDWFTNRKVPMDRRRRLVLAESERGTLFWVEGERISEDCKVTPATRRVLELRWKRR